MELCELGLLRRSLPDDPAQRREIREAAGVTTTELAEALGVSRQVLLQWEKGVTTPRPRLRARYAEALSLLAESSP